MKKELEDKINQEMENKWNPAFDRQAGYVGNGIYTIAGLYSKDTRELFLMFIAQQEFNTTFD
jgi:hypothetical protein